MKDCRHIFFLANLFFFKQGISYVHVMVDFIRMGLLELWASWVERELQNVRFLPTVGFELGTFRSRSERAATELRGLMLSSG